jgi:4-hydroxybenzoate polyprenyltransferase
MTDIARDLTPLCVDLDGTLVNTDLLMEGILQLIRKNPLYVFAILIWSLRGMAGLKAEIAVRTNVTFETIPFNQPLLAWLIKEHAGSRPLYLCTGANRLVAGKIADHLGIFAGVIASDTLTNLTGTNKSVALQKRFPDGFDYCGNDRNDLKVWRAARRAILVNTPLHIAKHAKKLYPIAAEFQYGRINLRQIFKAIRIHQWVKNLLIFIPMIAAHKTNNFADIVDLATAFFCFSFCASAVYIINDLIDIDNDRMHHKKRNRPFASGTIGIVSGGILATALLSVSTYIAASLSFAFCAILIGYFIMTIAYSLSLKKVAIVDTITLAGLYTIRIIAGGVAVKIEPSFWLLIFSLFFFFSLASLKRFAELHAAMKQGKTIAHGRGYNTNDITFLQNTGITSGYLSSLVLALYINNPNIGILYQLPQIIWLLCGLNIFWIGHVWLTAHRGNMNEDPIIFAIKDKTSLCAMLLGAIAIYIAA